MSQLQITSLSLRLAGIYSLIQAILMIRPVINSFGFASQQPSVGTTLILGASIPFILLIIFGLLLFIGSNRISRRIIREKTSTDISSELNSKKIQAIAFSILGVILVIISIPKILQIISNIVALQNAADNSFTIYKLSRDTIAFGIGVVLQFLFGIYLFISGHSLSNLWHKIVQRIEYEKNITSP